MVVWDFLSGRFWQILAIMDVVECVGLVSTLVVVSFIFWNPSIGPWPGIVDHFINKVSSKSYNRVQTSSDRHLNLIIF